MLNEERERGDVRKGGREGGRGDDIKLIKPVQCTHTGIIHNAHTHTDTHSLKAVMLSHMGTNLLLMHDVKIGPYTHIHACSMSWNHTYIEFPLKLSLPLLFVLCWL